MTSSLVRADLIAVVVFAGKYKRLISSLWNSHILLLKRLSLLLIFSSALCF